MLSCTLCVCHVEELIGAREATNLTHLKGRSMDRASLLGLDLEQFGPA